MRDQALNANASKSLAALSQDWANQGRWDRALRLATIGVEGFDAPLVGFDPSDARAAAQRAAAGLRTVVATGARQGVVTTAVFAPDGRSVISGGPDGVGRIWDAGDGHVLGALPGDAHWLINISVSKLGGCAVTADENEGARLWNLASNKLVRTLSLARGQVAAAACSPDGNQVITTGEDDTAVIWDAHSGARLHTLSGHTGQVISVAISPDGKLAATGSSDHTARVWNLATGAPVAELKGHTGNVVDIDFSPDSTRVATASLDHTGRIWDAATGAPKLVLAGQEKGVDTAEFSPDGATVATAGQDGTTRLWDATTGLELRRITGFTELVNSAFWSPDGKTLVTGSDEGLVKIWRLDPGRSLDDGQVISVARFGAGGALVVATQAGAVEAWDSAGRVLHRYDTQGSPVLSLAVSRDRSLIAAGSEDGKVVVYDSAAAAPPHVLNAGAGEIRGVGFTPDGKQLVSAGADGRLTLWEVASGQPVRNATFSGNEGKAMAILAGRPAGRHIEPATATCGFGTPPPWRPRRSQGPQLLRQQPDLLRRQQAPGLGLQRQHRDRVGRRGGQADRAPRRRHRQRLRR